MSYSPEFEVLGFVYSTLSNDTELLTQSGIDPTTGNARSVTVANQPPQDTSIPFVRFTLSDTVPLGQETYDLTTQPLEKSVSVMVDAFSTYEPELLKIAARLQVLLQHTAVATDHFEGSTWLTAVDYFTDNTSDPDRVYHRASLRVCCNVEPSS